MGDDLEHAPEVAKEVLNHREHFDDMHVRLADALASLSARLAEVERENERLHAVFDISHEADCAHHNEPAYPAGPCDCGAYERARWGELEALSAEVERMRAVVGFFASVIKSGEPWTAECEQALRAALPKRGD